MSRSGDIHSEEVTIMTESGRIPLDQWSQEDLRAAVEREFAQPERSVSESLLTLDGQQVNDPNTQH